MTDITNSILPQLTEASDVGCWYLVANDFKAMQYLTASGKTFVYFKGHLARDLCLAFKNKSPHASAMKLMRELAAEQSDLGSLCLTQRILERSDDGRNNTYEYCATKRKL